MKKETVEERIDRLNKRGYTVIHLFKDLYLVRKYSKYYKKISLYVPQIFKDGD